MWKFKGPFWLVICLLFSGCQDETTVQVSRPVRTVVVHPAEGETVTLTGQIAAHKAVNASFRTGGKLLERLVSVGDTVHSGQILARLDAAVIRDTLLAASSDVAAAQATLNQASSHAARMSSLVQEGAVSRSEHDLAVRQLKAARAQLEAADARRHSASEQLGYTDLRADAGGIVVGRYAESGEVVSAGQPIFRIAEDHGYDAVFDVPEGLVQAGLAVGQKVRVCLDNRREVCAEAELYELSPEADAMTRTYQAKTLLADRPETMLLGSTVVGSMTLSGSGALVIPAAALSSSEGHPAVWIVDGASSTVSLRPVQVARYTRDTVVLSGGLKEGERIVTAGVQTMRPGQTIQVMEDNHEAR